ncbi:hypothetical protein Poli38472_007350 [Pythium oligandrum]|uniref:FYVE-type domain-containing protein n=1 Tax=Pythium oligandrum TaxID=41045 RepID=A0A8K1FD99_PYTOL|nr:hypothetical protein Poli38472_007350 [Pythium oligandrum]|eukprot:TMW59205.1 hypothetical protein Poli38472_007350 [Pythium oligandrum]
MPLVLTASRFQHPFGGARLRPSELAQLRLIPQTILDEGIATYEYFLREHGGLVDPAQWEMFKERERLTIYKRRDYMPQMYSSSVHEKQPDMLMVGTVEGSLDDMMYGVVNHTTELMRIKTAYVEDGNINGAVVATLEEPTADEPFRSMTLKWALRGDLLHVRSTVRNRDLVYVEKTGTTKLRSGERVGYQLVRSVSIAGVPTLDWAHRSFTSILAVFRERWDGGVDVYATTMLDTHHDIPRSLIHRSAAEAMISVWKYVHCGRMKKLCWYLHSRRSEIESTDQKLCENGICATCASKFSFLSGAKKKWCLMCSNRVCSSCRVKKTICGITDEGHLRQINVNLCGRCLGVVENADAHALASAAISTRTSEGEIMLGQTEKLFKRSRRFQSDPEPRLDHFTRSA